MRRLSALIAAALLAAPLAAQDITPVIDPGVAGMNAVLYSVQKSEERRAARTAPSRPLAIARALRSPAPATARTASFRYTATPALRRAAFDGVVARARATDPRRGEAIASAFAGQDHDRIYRGIAGRYGLRGDDAADALAAYLVLGWIIANGADDADPVAVRAARAQVAAAVADDPRFAAPGQRARIGEEFKILFVVIHAGWQSAARENTLDGYRTGVARLFRSGAGVDLTRLRLTPAGFAPR